MLNPIIFIVGMVYFFKCVKTTAELMIIYETSCHVSEVSEEDQDKTTSTIHSKQSVGKSNSSISTIKTVLELLSDEAVSK